MNKTLIALAIVLGLVFCVIGFVYASHTGENLPHYFPGYAPGYDRVHVKHSVAAFVVGAAFFVFAWFKSGTKNNGNAPQV